MQLIEVDIKNLTCGTIWHTCVITCKRAKALAIASLSIMSCECAPTLCMFLPVDRGNFYTQSCQAPTINPVLPQKSFWGKRHGAHFAAQSGVYCPQQPVLTHLSRLVSACRSNTLGWAPSFRLTVCISLMRTYVPLSKHGIWGVIHPIMGIYGNPFSVGKYKSL